VQPSSSMKHSFSPARSSVADGHLPAAPYSALLVKRATIQSGRKFGRQGLCQSSSGECRTSATAFKCKRLSPLRPFLSYRLRVSEVAAFLEEFGGSGVPATAVCAAAALTRGPAQGARIGGAFETEHIA
jgi:hypothetical protein